MNETLGNNICEKENVLKLYVSYVRQGFSAWKVIVNIHCDWFCRSKLLEYCVNIGNLKNKHLHYIVTLF